MPGIRQVAKEAGVSIATVSRVLNNHASVGQDVRSRVLGAANRLGYVSSIGKRSTTCLAFAYTGPSSISSPYDAMLLEGINQAMGEADLDLLILNLHRDKKPGETYSQLFMRKGVRGVILRTTAGTRGICQTIAEEAFPCVVVGSRLETPGVHYVYADSLNTSRQAVEHLVGLGHKRIGITLSLVEDSDHTDRLEGYRQALQEHGIEYDPKLVFRVPAQRPDGAQLIKRILSASDTPTALYITDPDVVIGAINQAHRMGIRIPEDLSIVGMDDGDNRKDTYPQLSAVCQDAVQIGYEAFTALTRIIGPQSQQDSDIRMSLPTWFEVHDTTGPPPSQAVRIMPDGTRVSNA